MRRSCAWK